MLNNLFIMIKYYLLFLVVFIVFTSCNNDKPVEENKAEAVAKAHGIENFSKAEMIAFTFNVQRDTAAASSRQWQWFPQTNEAVFITDSGSTRFSRTDTSTAALKKLNARFTNDEYWLLFPFHLLWDKGFHLQDSGMQTAPISGKQMRKLAIHYNKTDGFTPGDSYDIFIDENNRLQEWAFHKGGAAEPSLQTTWQDYETFKGMELAKEHRSKDGKFRLWFSGIKVE